MTASSRVYRVLPLTGENPFAALAGVEPAEITEYPWDAEGYTPRTEVRIGWTVAGLFVRFSSSDDQLRTVYTAANDPVCRDSCVEFFLNPVPEKDSRYLNFETNAIGTLMLGLGSSRHDRVLIPESEHERFGVTASLAQASAEERTIPWTVTYGIPLDFLQEIYGPITWTAGHTMLGNFYKCGDDTPAPHFGCWNRIEHPQPDFHRPEYFGRLVLG